RLDLMVSVPMIARPLFVPEVNAVHDAAPAGNPNPFWCGGQKKQGFIARHFSRRAIRRGLVWLIHCKADDLKSSYGSSGWCHWFRNPLEPYHDLKSWYAPR